METYRCSARHEGQTPAMCLSARHNYVIFAVLTAMLMTASVVVAAPAQAQAPTCHGQRATIVARPGRVTVGTPGDDVIVGTPGRDVIRSGAGADVICARGGADDVKSGAGADLVDLGSGDDSARTGSGADIVIGGAGRDIIKGQRGSDLMLGGDGNDVCRGGPGKDTAQSCNDRSGANGRSSKVNSYEAAMVAMVQDLREQHGVGQLKVNIELGAVARTWSTRLPGNFNHNPRVGSEIPRGWRAWGENVAFNGSVDAAFNALVGSPGHFANLVDPDFTDIGIGVYVQNGRVYVTQVFARY